MKRKAVYAGTFDPPTSGHEWMLREAARLFDEVVFAIGTNPEKKTMFPLAERMEMLEELAAPLANVTVASYVNQYLIHYAVSVGAEFIVRGIRNGGDYEYEKAMRHINADLDHRVTTVFLMPPRNISEVSSSVVKGLAGTRGWERVVANYVSVPVLKRLIEAKHSLWQNLQSIGARGEKDFVWAPLLDCCFKPGRHYHDWRHITAMLADFYLLRDQAADPVAVETAIWFHDAVYDPKASDNEERSADLAAAVATRVGLGPDFSSRVRELILATKHSAAPATADAQLLVDLDLSVFGQSAERFDEYEAGVRAEYDWVPPREFAAKRAAVLRQFLDRPRIYSTERCRERWEDAARANLRRSIDQLDRVALG